MTGETAGRPLLPQTTQTQSYSFAPPTLAPRENQRNYVFVDEHNRHKRLKVMRACEGCRRRKIKCDAATTNTWPCAACTRLKLNCVPPAVGYDKDFTPNVQTFEVGRTHEYDTNTAIGIEEYPRQQYLPPTGTELGPSLHHLPQRTYADAERMYQPVSYIAPPQTQDALQYSTLPPPVMRPQELKYHQQAMYTAAPNSTTLVCAGTDSLWRPDLGSSGLAEALGELKIDYEANAPYITNQKKTLAEEPAVEEYEISLPIPASPDLTVRIPLEMMPSEQEAQQYFDYFFNNIHPYVPVINRSYFYQQWQTNRDSISPLILEAIFACASLIIDGPTKGNKWLALASKHEESFKDVPRLSTIQAMLLILKARESSPKRGYYWRSWMSVVNLVAMAKELELDQHLELHLMGKSCGSSIYDCATKTRVWNVLYVSEAIIGGGQGRSDFAVKPETVDFDVPQSIPGLDDGEMQVLRRFTYFMRTVRHIEQSNQLHARLRKKKKDWALDPEFLQHNEDFTFWIRDLPRDLQVVYPTDSSPPWIPSHFVGNLHCQHYLGLIMHHRPQIHVRSDAFDPSWKQHMILCHAAAKSMCRLQEAILETYGLPGLFCMQRGVSFHIYCVLTCTMLHLAAITSPDPELNCDARDFFVRHMRLLEQCTPSWPMPELHTQINALREAFSADTSKPFELKPSFPFGSPTMPHHSSQSSHESSYLSRVPGHDSSIEQPGQVNYSTHPITPPISANGSDPKADSPVVQSLVMMATGQRLQPPPTAVQSQDAVQWNPTRIFDQWNVAFGTPPPSTASQSSPPLRPPPPGTYDVRTPVDTPQTGYTHHSNFSPHGSHLPIIPAQLPPPVTYQTPPAAPYVSPSMWQDVVASSFGDGVKRRWDYASPGMIDTAQVLKRQR